MSGGPIRFGWDPHFISVMTLDPPTEDWRSVLDVADTAALAAYARPREPLTWEAPILLVIDVTERFVGPDLPVLEAQRASRQACGERAWRALPAIAALVGRFRELGHPVVFTVPDPLQTWVGAATRGAVAADEGTVGAGVVDAVRPEDNDVVIVKTKASAFGGTPLVHGLIASRRRTVVMCGGTTSGCVRASANDSTSLGFETVVAADACFDRSRLSHLVSLADLDTKYAAVLDSDEILGHLPTL
jgi:maleamate amidohydrolase